MCLFLSVFLNSVGTNAAILPDNIPDYKQKEIPCFGTTESHIFKNPTALERENLEILTNLVKIRNYFAECQTLLKEFYTEKYLDCLVFTDIDIIQDSSHSLSMVNFSIPLLTEYLPNYIDTIDKIDMNFIKKHREHLPCYITIKTVENEFYEFLEKVKTSRLLSSKFIDDDVSELHSLICGKSAELVTGLESSLQRISKTK